MIYYNLLHIILGFCKDLPLAWFATSKTELAIYYENLCMRVASRVAQRLNSQVLRKLGNIMQISKSGRDLTTHKLSSP